jgi:hypothetical protein
MGLFGKSQLLCGTLACLAMTGSRLEAAPLEVPQPATWMSHDLVVDLHDLPKQYSCTDLWYKFRDVLLALGARPDLHVLAYNCRTPTQAGTRSPSIHLRFSLPEILRGKDTRWADVRAVESTVRIEPGRPSTLASSDCELLQQMRNTLLAELQARVVSDSLRCGLSVVTLTAKNAGQQPVVASAASQPQAKIQPRSN